MALLISAGLFIKSLRNVSRVDLGIDIDNMVTFGISPALSGYDSGARARRSSRASRRSSRRIPGVTRRDVVDACRCSPAATGARASSVEGFQKDPDTDDGSRYNAVGPNYFHVLGVPLLAGRDFTASDNAGAPKVAIVNEAFAKKFNLGNERRRQAHVGGQRFAEHRDRRPGRRTRSTPR